LPDESPDLALRVLVIDDNSERAKLVEEGLSENAIVRMATQLHGRSLLELITDWHPDVIIMDCQSPDRDTIESLRQVAHSTPKPIVMFVEEDNQDHMQDAIEAGVSAYVVDGLTPRRVRPLIDTAIARFRVVDGLKSELRKTKENLEARKVIEHAKGLLMDTQKISEVEAFRSMRDLSQKQGKPMKEIAENIISVLGMLHGKTNQEKNT